MTFPEIVESKDLLWGRTCAVDNVRARRKGVLGKLYEIQISPERGLRNSLKFPSYFGMEYVRPWNMGKKLLECWSPDGFRCDFWGKYIRTAQKSAQRLHQFSCSLWFSSCSKLGICHMFISWWCLLALHFHWDLCWTPSKNVTFFGWFCVSPQRQRFFSITSTCGPSLQWYHTHQHFDVCIAIAMKCNMCVHRNVFTELKHTCAT